MKARLEGSFRHRMRVRVGPTRAPGQLLKCLSKRTGKPYWSVKLDDGGGWVFPDASMLVDGIGDAVSTCAQCNLPFLMEAGSGEMLCASCHVEQFGEPAARAGEPPPQRRWNSHRRWR